MSGGVYTTTVDILGGADTEDEWGDPVEGTTVIGDPVPMTITERRQVVATESDPQAVAVHYYTGRMPRRFQVNSGQRLRDRVTMDLYMIDYVNRPTNDPTGTAETRLDLRRVT